MTGSSGIRLLVTDVDGTLTDGGMYYTKDGEFMKEFNTRDAMGLSMIAKIGIIVCILTSEASDIVLSRAKKLNIEHVYIGVKNKLQKLTDICRDLNIGTNEVAYIGDDVNDLKAMKKVGCAFAVADADPRVKKIAHVILKKNGGHGAVREATEILLKNANVDQREYLP